LISACATYKPAKEEKASKSETSSAITDGQAMRIIQKVASRIEKGEHIYARSTFPKLNKYELARLEKISYENINTLEQIMQDGTDYEKEVVVFGIQLKITEEELIKNHNQFVTDVYLFITSLKEARSGTTPPRHRPEILYEYDSTND